jgi:hypothetical protein
MRPWQLGNGRPEGQLGRSPTFVRGAVWSCIVRPIVKTDNDLCCDERRESIVMERRVPIVMGTRPLHDNRMDTGTELT